MADVLNEILRAANKHPNSRVSKLIHTVEEEPSQKNIVLLLIELAEHAEYSTDFNVSLKYYLELFERLGINHDLVLNEAGLLLVNSSKIYSKRVDYVQSLVERQIITLSNADDEIEKQKLEQQQAENATPVEKPKRGRKRALEMPTDPYEIELVPKKFKKLSEEKRFTQPKTNVKPKSIQRNIEMEQHIHPAGWLHATIYDLENEEDVDTKRNYKLFTYHIEHRYNTLVPDINFRLHFKVKDYMDEQEEMEEDEACNTDRTWPPLSEAYVEKYIRLENYVLQQDVKANKRKSAEMEFKDTRELEENMRGTSKDIIESMNGKHDADDVSENMTESSLEQSLLNAFQVKDASNINGKNNSGLGQSILDESNNTLENTQLNCALETSSNPEYLNESAAQTEANKTINISENSQENDSALGSSILDQTNTTENNITLDTTGNLEITNNTENHNELGIDASLSDSVLEQTSNSSNSTKLETSTISENLNDSASQTEVNKSLNTTYKSQENDSALGSSVLDQTNTTENNISADLDTTNSTEIPNEQENNLSLSTSDLEQTTNTENNSTLETSTAISSTFDSTYSEENEKIQTEELSKATENRKDSALTDDRHHSISTENLAISRESLNSIDDKTLDLNVKQQECKDTTQIRVQLPHTDDEGVCLSDLEDHNDCRLLSPIIKATNILPGVERKDITIYMDEELRLALEMRDGIMEHFGPETYKVPVITEAKKHNLLFNIFKLPEKLVRRKVLFKLGPEMDLYLQARSFKRSKPEPAVPRTYRNIQYLQWYSLNNTDMTGVYITPPSSPGHCSDFCGFSDQEDNEDDDTVSCADFCGFTEEEQSTLISKNINRLSRDSGVGVDVNTLTPEKETLDVIFEESEYSAIENCKRILDLDEAAKTHEVNTDQILNQLPEDIRDILTTELEETNGNNLQENSENNETDLENSNGNNSEEKDKLCEETSLEKTGDSEELITESSQENLESSTNENSESLTTETNYSQESVILSANAIEDELKTQDNMENSSPLDANESQAKSSDNINESFKNTVVDEITKSAEEILKETLDSTNIMEEIDNSEDRYDQHMENDVSDDEMLDLDTQGSKTKIQQWHEHLQPILAKSRERHHFDVFQLGTEIIDTVQSKGETSQENPFVPPNKPIATFHDIMDNKDQSYVSRYFLSTLLLANQSNIEITINNKSSEKPSSWHDIHLKLLSTKRHTVAIEDNIGMIDNKLKSKEKPIKTNIKEKQNKKSSKEVEENEDKDNDEEPLINLQSTKTLKKSTNKRNSECTSSIAEKKPKHTTTPTHCRPNNLPNLIESVQIIKSPQAPTKDMLMMLMPSTSQQTQNFNNPLSNIAIQTLQPIKKKWAKENITKYFRKIKNLPVIIT
ncbi:chromosome associated protein H2 isoform 2-T2 [Cochliomyia hominivorax]